MREALPDLKSSNVIYNGRVFTITLDEITYPDGRVVKMEVVRHPGSVVLLPMTAPDRILLVQQLSIRGGSVAVEVKEFSVEDVRAMVRIGDICDMKTAVGITLLSREDEQEVRRSGDS